ncbi:MAG: hypothetical protein ACRDYY_14735, partial [Acidimicrobiales bacterium]
SPRDRRGLVDTSVVIDFEQLDAQQLPIELAVSAITMAELAAGPPCDGGPRGTGTSPIDTRNPEDFRGLRDLVRVVAV